MSLRLEGGRVPFTTSSLKPSGNQVTVPFPLLHFLKSQDETNLRKLTLSLFPFSNSLRYKVLILSYTKVRINLGPVFIQYSLEGNKEVENQGEKTHNQSQRAFQLSTPSFLSVVVDIRVGQECTWIVRSLVFHREKSTMSQGLYRDTSGQCSIRIGTWTPIPLR